MSPLRAPPRFGLDINLLARKIRLKTEEPRDWFVAGEPENVVVYRSDNPETAAKAKLVAGILDDTGFAATLWEYSRLATDAQYIGYGRGNSITFSVLFGRINSNQSESGAGH
jgi:hypothetical protein